MMEGDQLHETVIHVEQRWRENEHGGRTRIMPTHAWFVCCCGAEGTRFDRGDEEALALRESHEHMALAKLATKVSKTK